jgi:hypothetical protein
MKISYLGFAAAAVLVAGCNTTPTLSEDATAGDKSFERGLKQHDVGNTDVGNTEDEAAGRKTDTGAPDADGPSDPIWIDPSEPPETATLLPPLLVART